MKIKRIITKHIIEPRVKAITDKFLKREPVKKVLITKEQLVDILFDWREEEKPNGIEKVAASSYYQHLCKKLNL